MPNAIHNQILRIQDRRLPKPAPLPPKDVTKNRVIARNGTLGVERLALDNPTYHNKVTLHVSPDESRLAILDAIKNAKEAFWLEIFIWHNDESGQEIAQALIDRKRLAEERGEPFDMKILIDWSGLRDATNPAKDTEIVKFLRDNGIEVREFNVGAVDPTATGATPITHRKLFIQDGTKYLSGGRNIGDEYLKPTFFSPGKQSERSWHDLMFTVEGDETARIQREFLKNWVAAGGKVPARIPKATPAKGGTAWVQSVVTDPHLHKKELRETQLKLIRNAQSEIRIVYPYFSDDAMIQELILAKKRNPKLDIKVMMPGKGERGIPGFLYNNLNLESARQLLEAGVDVRFLSLFNVGNEQVESFSHFKAMAVDGKVLSIGSANGDARTLSQNHELNSIIFDRPAAKKFIDEQLEPDWKLAKPVKLADIAALPFWKKWVMKILESVDFLF